MLTLKDSGKPKITIYSYPGKFWPAGSRPHCGAGFQPAGKKFPGQVSGQVYRIYTFALFVIPAKVGIQKP
jgi:hypothetical protein